MAVWMELRCDWRSAPEPEYPSEDRCDSSSNHGPMDMASNSSADVAEQRRRIFDTAKAWGWKKIGSNIACPGCSRRIARGELPKDPDA